MTETDIQLAPPIGHPIDLSAPWVPPVSPAELAQGEPQVFDPGAVPGFAEWLASWSDRIAPQVQRKAAEYGSNSLAKKGYRFAAAQSMAVAQPQALELGALQYVLEKLDRAEDAMLRTQLPSDDTLVDATVYLLMVLYIRANGRWL